MPTDKQLSTFIVHKIPTQEMYEALKDAGQINSDDICWVENPSAAKLATAKTITLGQQLQGSAQFDGSSDITINGQLKHCVELAFNADCATYPWFKVADVVLDNVKFEDRIITFRVDNTYANQEYGILRARVRVESNTVLQVASLQWEYASPNINPSDFVLTTIQDDTKVKAELWCKISKQANSKHFVVLHEAQRRSDANYWTLYDNTVGVASYTTGDNVTAVESVISNLKNSINGNALTASKLATPRTITLDGGLQGSVSFDGSKNITLNGYLKSCSHVDHTADVVTNSWHKVASTLISGTNVNHNITFKVHLTNEPTGFGILHARVATKASDISFKEGCLCWEYASADINPDDYILVYTNTSDGLSAEIWCKITKSASSCHFTVLNEGRLNVNAQDEWTLYSSTDGVSTHTVGTDMITSAPVKLQNETSSVSKPKVSSVTLSASSWTDNGDETFSQTVTISNGTSNSKVELQPDNTTIMQMINDGVVSLRIDNDNGTFTAVAIKAKPTTDLTIQITLTEVE